MQQYRAVTEAKLGIACIKFAVKISHNSAEVRIVIKQGVDPDTEVTEAINKTNSMATYQYTVLSNRAVKSPWGKVHANSF